MPSLIRASPIDSHTVDLAPLQDSQRALPGLGRLDREKDAALMTALDACNKRFGRGTVVSGGAGFAQHRSWSTRFEMRSPRYTTRPAELQVVSAAGASHPSLRAASLRAAGSP